MTKTSIFNKILAGVGISAMALSAFAFYSNVVPVSAANNGVVKVRVTSTADTSKSYAMCARLTTANTSDAGTLIKAPIKATEEYSFLQSGNFDFVVVKLANSATPAAGEIVLGAFQSAGTLQEAGNGTCSSAVFGDSMFAQDAITNVSTALIDMMSYDGAGTAGNKFKFTATPGFYYKSNTGDKALVNVAQGSRVFIKGMPNAAANPNPSINTPASTATMTYTPDSANTMDYTNIGHRPTGVDLVTAVPAPTGDPATGVTASNGIEVVPAQDMGIMVTQLPTKGDLFVNGTKITTTGAVFTQQALNDGLVEYRHTGTDATPDSFKVRPSFRNTNNDNREVMGAEDTINISVALTAAVGSFEIKGDRIADIAGSNCSTDGNKITMADLSIVNKNNATFDTTKMRFVIASGVTNTVIRKSGNAIVAGGTFTVSDINAGLVTIDTTATPAGITVDSFTFNAETDNGGTWVRLKDANNADILGQVVINIKPISNFVLNNQATLNSGVDVTKTITSSVLKVSEASETCNIAYRVEAPYLGRGVLTKQKVVMTPGSVFTQKDIDAGLVSYYSETGEITASDFKAILTVGLLNNSTFTPLKSSTPTTNPATPAQLFNTSGAAVDQNTTIAASQVELMIKLVGETGNPATSCNPAFPDVATSYIFYNDICTLQQAKVVNGFPNGMFMPEQNVTRGQMAKFVRLGMNMPVKTDCAAFPDVATSYTFYDDIMTLKCNGVVNGYQDGMFKPEASVTRGEAMKFIIKAARMVKNDPAFLPNNTTLSFPDVPSSYTFYDEIMRALSNGITSGFEDGMYRPESNITRGQMSALINRTRAKIM